MIQKLVIGCVIVLTCTLAVVATGFALDAPAPLDAPASLGAPAWMPATAQEWDLPPPPTAPPLPAGEELEKLIKQGQPNLVPQPIVGTDTVYIGKSGELAVTVPEDLVISGLIISSCPAEMADACVKTPAYTLSPSDSLSDESSVPPVVLFVEQASGKVWPDKSKSKEAQAAQLEQYRAFIAQMPSAPAPPGDPIWQ